jgi:Predicted transcriptional regulator
MQENTKEIYSINKRIFQTIEYLGKTRYKISQETGISEAILNNIDKNKNKASIDVVEKILNNYSAISSEWLVTGQGSMLKEKEVHQDDELLINNEQNNISERKLIPFFDGIVEAGTAVVANMDGAYPAEMVDAGDFFLDATAVMQVHGDSMLPDYKPGSLIPLKEVHNKRLVMPGQDYVIETTEYRVVKRLQKSTDKTCWLACSINTETWEQGPLKGQLIHEPFDVPIDEVIHIYIVLGQIQRKQSSKIVYSR